MIDRPYVICHILSSIDGRIDGDFFDAPQMFALRLKNVQKLDGDVVWLRYER